ncbi:MAG TPA: hypothetical protein VF427_07915 [Noviherbaspirillum sp.]
MTVKINVEHMQKINNEKTMAILRLPDISRGSEVVTGLRAYPRDTDNKSRVVKITFETKFRRNGCRSYRPSGKSVAYVGCR